MGIRDSGKEWRQVTLRDVLRKIGSKCSTLWTRAMAGGFTKGQSNGSKINGKEFVDALRPQVHLFSNITGEHLDEYCVKHGLCATRPIGVSAGREPTRLRLLYVEGGSKATGKRNKPRRKTRSTTRKEAKAVRVAVRTGVRRRNRRSGKRRVST